MSGEKKRKHIGIIKKNLPYIYNCMKRINISRHKGVFKSEVAKCNSQMRNHCVLLQTSATRLTRTKEHKEAKANQSNECGEPVV